MKEAIKPVKTVTKTIKDLSIPEAKSLPMLEFSMFLQWLDDCRDPSVPKIITDFWGNHKVEVPVNE